MANTTDITIVKAIPPFDHRIISFQSRIVHWHVHAICSRTAPPHNIHLTFSSLLRWFHTNAPRYRSPLDVIFVTDIQVLFRYPA
jgi:hypothetical protein